MVNHYGYEGGNIIICGVWLRSFVLEMLWTVYIIMLRTVLTVVAVVMTS